MAIVDQLPILINLMGSLNGMNKDNFHRFRLARDFHEVCEFFLVCCAVLSEVVPFEESIELGFLIFDMEGCSDKGRSVVCGFR